METETTALQWVGRVGMIATIVVFGAIAWIFIRKRVDSRIYAALIYMGGLTYGVMGSLVRESWHILIIGAVAIVPVALSMLWVMPRYYRKLDEANRKVEARRKREEGK